MWMTMVRSRTNSVGRCSWNLRLVVVLVLFVAATVVTATNSNAETKGSCEEDGTCVPKETTKATTTEAAKDDAEVVNPNCKDEDPEANCFTWAVTGECEKNPAYMLLKCQKSCGVCDGGRKVQQQQQQQQQQVTVTASGETVTNPLDDLPSSPENGWGVEQEILGTPLQTMATQAVVDQTKEYMLTKVFVDPRYASVKAKCKNREALCSFWASAGECVENVVFMQSNCAPACQTCEMMDFSTRCPFDLTKAPLDDNVWNTNFGLNEMFLRILNDPTYQSLQPKVQRKPKAVVAANATDNNVPDGPWIVTFDNFLTPEECDALLLLGKGRGYNVATNIAGTQRFDGTYESHVATVQGDSIQVAWCLDDCDNHAVSQSVASKITNMTGIPSKNLDYFQLRQYPASKFLHETHDFARQHLVRAQGPRILTLFVFLSDEGSDGGSGGQVRFPKLENLTIEPKQGRAILWPNVLHRDPNEVDTRTIHQNLPVTEGVQYGLTAWIHLRDFKTPHKANCI